MLSSPWIALLRRLPADQHAHLAIVTTIGVEIIVQAILHIEEDYLTVRGRLSGSQDANRAYFVPFDQINFLGLQREVTEAEVKALFDDAPAAELAAPPAEAKPEEAATVPAEDDPAAVPEPSALAASSRAVRSPFLRKNSILERLRARSQPGMNQRPPAEP